MKYKVNYTITNGEKIESFTKEKIFYINSIYDEYLQKTEKRGLSWGELAYIEGLNDKELEELENEILKELEKMGANDEK